jgi:hypothetical protein
MSRKTLYVIDDGLVYAGRSYVRGDVIALDSAAEQQLLEEKRVSTTESPAAAPAGADPAATAPSIGDVSTEDLVAELEARDDYTPPAPFDYDKLKVEQLEQVIEARKAALEVTGTGKDGDVVKADLVKTLTDADAALAAS